MRTEKKTVEDYNIEQNTQEDLKDDKYGKNIYNINYHVDAVGSNGDEGENNTEIPIASNKNPYMPRHVQHQMETSFNQDFSNVNIYKNSSSAKKLNARAYAKGNDIHFAQGEFNPYSKSGLELLGHELAHVVQQRQGVVSPKQILGKGLFGNQDTNLENQADKWGTHASLGMSIGLDRLPNTTALKGIVQKTGITDPESPRMRNGDFFLRIDADGNQLDKELELIFRVRPSMTSVTDENGISRQPGTVEVLVRPTEMPTNTIQSVLTFEIPEVADFSIDRQTPVIGVFGYEIEFSKLNLILKVNLNLDQRSGLMATNQNLNYTFRLFNSSDEPIEAFRTETLINGQEAVATFPTWNLDRNNPISLREFPGGPNVDEIFLREQVGVSKEGFVVYLSPYGDQFMVTLNKSSDKPGVIEWSATAVYPKSSFTFYAKNSIPVPYSVNDDRWFENLQIRVTNTGQHIALFYSIPNSNDEKGTPSFYSEPSTLFFGANTPAYISSEPNSFLPGDENRNVRLLHYVPQPTENNGLNIHKINNGNLLFQSSGVTVKTEGNENQDYFTYVSANANMTTLQHVSTMARDHAKKNLGNQRENTTMKQESRLMLFNLARLVKKANQDGFIKETEYQLYYKLATLLVQNDSVLQESFNILIDNKKTSLNNNEILEKFNQHKSENADAYAEINDAFVALTENHNEFFMSVHNPMENKIIEQIKNGNTPYFYLHDELLIKAGRKLKFFYDDKLKKEKADENQNAFFQDYYSYASKELGSAITERKKFFDFVEQIEHDKKDGLITEFHTVQSIFYSGPSNYNKQHIQGVNGRIFVFKQLHNNGGCTWYIISLMKRKKGSFFRQEISYNEDTELKDEVFNLLDDKDFAQEGLLIYQVPGAQVQGIGKHGQVEMTSPFETHDYISFGALALNGIGLACTITGVGAPFGTVFFAAGGLMQFGASLNKLYDNKGETGDFDRWDIAYAVVDGLMALGGGITAVSATTKGLANSNSLTVKAIKIIDPVSGLVSFALTTADSFKRILEKIEEGDMDGVFSEVMFLLFTGGMGVYAAKDQLKSINNTIKTTPSDRDKIQFFNEIKSPKPLNEKVDFELEEILHFKNDLQLKPEELLEFYSRKEHRMIVNGEIPKLSPKEEILKLKRSLEHLEPIELAHWMKNSPELKHISKVEKLELLEKFGGSYKAANIELEQMNHLRELERKFRTGGFSLSISKLKPNYKYLWAANKKRLAELEEQLHSHRSQLKTLKKEKIDYRKDNPVFNHYLTQKEQLPSLKKDVELLLSERNLLPKQKSQIKALLDEIETQDELRMKAMKGLTIEKQFEIRKLSFADQLVALNIQNSDNLRLAEELKTILKTVDGQTIRKNVSEYYSPAILKRIYQRLDKITAIDRLYKRREIKYIADKIGKGKKYQKINAELIAEQQFEMEMTEMLLEGNKNLKTQMETFGKEIYGNGFKNISELQKFRAIELANSSQKRTVDQIKKLSRFKRFIKFMDQGYVLENFTDVTEFMLNKLAKHGKNAFKQLDNTLFTKNLRPKMIGAYKNLVTRTIPIIVRLMGDKEMNSKFSGGDIERHQIHFEYMNNSISPKEMLDFAKEYGLELLTKEEQKLLEDLYKIEESEIFK